MNYCAKVVKKCDVGKIFSQKRVKIYFFSEKMKKSPEKFAHVKKRQ